MSELTRRQTLSALAATAAMPLLSGCNKSGSAKHKKTAESPHRRQITVNTCTARLKAAGVWDKLLGLWIVGADRGASCKNWVSPGTHDLTIVGAPTFIPDVGWSSGTARDHLDTGITLNDINPAAHAMGLWSGTESPANACDMGAIDASGDGLTINCQGAGMQFDGRSMGGAFTGTGGDIYYGGSGFHALSRPDASQVEHHQAGRRIGTIRSGNVPVKSTSTIQILKTGGNPAAGSGRSLSAAFLANQYLSEKELQILYAALKEYFDGLDFGELDVTGPGVGPKTITADVIVYGATCQGVLAAYEARRQGKSVAICGGWRERRVGGMSSGGLSKADWDNPAALGGLPRYVLDQIDSVAGLSDATFHFEPRYCSNALRQMLDPAHGGLDIPIYWSKGVKTVAKSRRRILSLTTEDGRTFRGKAFIDCSYEGDLAWHAGCSMTFGREASGPGQESINGFRGTTTAESGGTQQFRRHPFPAGALVNISPYVVEGDASSGLLPFVSGTLGIDTPALGAGDRRLQAYNFRVTLSNNGRHIVPMPATPPNDYEKTRYEPLLRLLASDPTIAITDIFKFDPISSRDFDFNARGGCSTDPFGLNAGYATASYDRREAIWKAHERYTRGLFYLLQHDPDPRIPATLRSAVQAYGFSNAQYLDPHPNDELFWPTQLYVRECFRLAGDYVHTANDVVMADGTTPRSTKTVATASYTLDSHHVQALADPNGGTPRIWLEGNFNVKLAGDRIAPLPYEIMVPKAAEATNLLVTFAVSATHAAFGSIRIEFTAMQLGQAAGMAAALMIEKGVAAAHVDYAMLRKRLLASPTLTGEVPPVLPLAN